MIRRRARGRSWAALLLVLGSLSALYPPTSLASVEDLVRAPTVRIDSPARAAAEELNSQESTQPDLTFTAGHCGAASTIWERTRRGDAVKEHCALLVAASANLNHAPDQSLQYARRASERVPRSARAELLATHARLLIDRGKSVETSYDHLVTLYQRELEDERALVLAQWTSVDWLLAARCALAHERWDVAHERYRRVTLDLEGLGSERLMARALIEAAVAAVHADRKAVLEATTHLQEARRRVAPATRLWVELAQAVLEMRDQASTSGELPPISPSAREMLAEKANDPSLSGSVPLLPPAELALWQLLTARPHENVQAQRAARALQSAARPAHLQEFDRAILARMREQGL